MHNTVVGYDQPDTLRDHQYFVFLRSGADNPRNAFRATLSEELLDAVRISHQTVTLEGDGRFAQRARRSRWATTSAPIWRCCTASTPVRRRS